MNRICKKAVKFIVGHFEYEPHFLARINVWSKIIYKNFLTDLPVGLWWYKVTSYLLINFAHTENTTTQRMIYLISPIQQLEWSQKLKRSAKHVHIYQKKTTERRHWRRSSLFTWTVFPSYSCASVANFEQVTLCWERSYHKRKLSKQDIFLHLILQLLKFALRYV